MKFTSTNDIINRLKVLKPALQKKYPISSLGLFGSYARGDFHENSDIDILVEFNGSIGMGFFRLANELEDALSSKVDLVSRNGIKPHYLPYIEKNIIFI
ncbi:nucleotidyltransferase family protein [Niabella ginsengisoli]|uniref:Nucleotidyltransferase family protein n=1 Tax=Niabella ginsengisoli TaxID=522298 RepID=A0ABS9SNZ7_9BACT|nr:nucleotidyltransferase family protein [Niabella ginsengisoli]MCH5600097.1 nucleotidyltransferase family protein [Niabella ginsengisoli]